MMEVEEIILDIKDKMSSKVSLDYSKPLKWGFLLNDDSPSNINIHESWSYDIGSIEDYARICKALYDFSKDEELNFLSKVESLQNTVPSGNIIKSSLVCGF